MTTEQKLIVSLLPKSGPKAHKLPKAIEDLEHAQLFLMISSRLTALYFVKYAPPAGLDMLTRWTRSR